MSYTIPVYAPNLSKETLIELMRVQLGALAEYIGLEQVPRAVRFRAPEMEITLPEATPDLVVRVVQELLVAARTIGGSQFALRKEGYQMRDRPTSLSDAEIEQLVIAFGYEIEQVDVY
ncbi:MAG: hypothetical protein AAF752_04685 [Bacteroidota bacterium]